MSKLFDQGEVFRLGHSMDPETVGIWMWIVPDKFKVFQSNRFGDEKFSNSLTTDSIGKTDKRTRQDLQEIFSLKMDKSGHKPAQPVNVDLGFRYTLLPAKLTIIFLSSLLNLAV